MHKEETPGLAAGIAANAQIYADNVIINTPRGHGFAAEKANHLKDVLTGKTAQIVGGDNAKNGADAPKPQSALQVPDAATIRAVRNLWQKQKRQVNLLLVMDVSGSPTRFRLICHGPGLRPAQRIWPGP